MRKKIDPVVDEAIETLNMKDGPSRRRLIEGAGLFSATAAASALIAACSSSSSSSAAPTSTASAAQAAAGNFPTTPKWKFTFVNHVTDNSFFTPTQYGFQDAAALLGLPTPAWTGALSTQPTVPTMLSAFQAAVTAGSPGIATTVVSATSFVAPINSALAAGIPVITYNANGSTASPTNGMAYVGQDLYVSGQAVGTRLASLMKKGDTAVGIIAQPGSLNIQPRMDGATQALQAAGMTVMFGNKGVDAGASATQEATVVPEFIQSHGSSIQGIFAVDGGDTALLGTSLAKYDLVGKVARGRLRPGAADPDGGRGGPDRLHHRPVAVPAGLPAHAVHVPVAALRRPGGAAADGHRPEVRHQEQRGGLHRDADPVRGLYLQAGVHQAHRCHLDLIARTRDTEKCRFAAVHRGEGHGEPPRHWV